MTNNAWAADDYRSSFGFVTSYGDSVFELLDARPGERVLDLGCGTGEHAAALAAQGVDVVGVDASASMLEIARRAFPHVTFVEVDAVIDAPMLGLFDAVVSNAALHWMSPQESALAYVRDCLSPGGRFVAEMGGHGNVQIVRDIFRQALHDCGLGGLEIQENWFPTIPQQSALLEETGFEVTQMVLIDRPTPLTPGSTPADWCAHFRARTWEQVPVQQRPRLREVIDQLAEPLLHGPDGWWVDYRRLRFIAVAQPQHT